MERIPTRAALTAPQGVPIETRAPSADENNAWYWVPFLEKHPYMLENGLPSHGFHTRFRYGLDPQGKANDPFTEFLVMCILYTLIKSRLVGISGNCRKPFPQSMW
jgi:hypothetical protein